MININNVFWTVQGEGFNSGRTALFVRMPFCNLACSWCDTSFNTYEKWDELTFKKLAESVNAKFAVITGGEPTMNKHTPTVIKWLTELGFEIAIESNGTFAIPKGIDFVTISPKRDADYEIHPDAFEKADEFKYVVDTGFDFTILDKHKNSIVRLSLSPEFNDFDNNVATIIKYIQENPNWRISLQTHKWMKIP